MKKISAEFLNKIKEVHFLASNAFTSIPKELYLNDNDSKNKIENINREEILESNILDASMESAQCDHNYDNNISESSNNSKKLLN